ncbi:MAG: alpha/beta hydrolase [Actinomycetota bacterium]|nr:alpha/beta hydrolase [Actinomycetota bacterium]
MIVALAHREAGSGRPFVLLHAFPLWSAMWDGQTAGLADRCRVIAPDLRGFGSTELGTDEPSLDAAADDVAALLDRLGLGAVVLGGLSMGGYVAMAFLRRHGDRVAGLLLADTKAEADTEAARANRERIATTLLADPESTVLIDEVLPTLLGPTSVADRPSVTEQVRSWVRAAPPPAVAWAQRAMAARPDSLPILRAVTVPALVVVGEEDTLAPPSAAQAMADAISDATLVRIPAAGHLSAVEYPTAFNHAVVGLLERL